MTIDNKHVTSQAQGNLNTVLGAVGAGGTLWNLFGGGRTNNCCNHDNQPISRYDANLLLLLGNKDAEIALLQADKYTDQKLVEVYKDLAGQIKELEKEVRLNKEAQNAINTEQAVFNGVTTGALKCIREDIQELFGLTKLVIPSSSICPPPSSTGTTGSAAA